MIIKIPFKPKIFLSLLVVILILLALSFMLYKQTETIVHVDLYSFGLVFDPVWADQYWAISGLYQYSLILAVLFIGSSIAVFLNYFRRRRPRVGSVCSMLLILGAVFSILSTFFFSKLDFIVNNDLYSYGLDFSEQWYSVYLTTTRLMITLEVAIGVLAFSLAAIILASTKTSVNITPSKITDQTLIAVGTMTLALSIIYSSSVLALIGLGLLFWGVTFTYVSTDEYVKKILLETASSDQVVMLNHLVKETLQYKGNPIYLPPRFFRNSDACIVYISKEMVVELPKPEMMPEADSNLMFDLVKNPRAVLMKPPGAELAQLLEKMLGTNFNRVNLEYLQQSLPKLLVEELEIVQSFDMKIDNDKVTIMIEGSAYGDPTKTAMESDTTLPFGSPLSNAIACSIAKVTGKQVVRSISKLESKAKLLSEEYLILEDTQ